MILTDQQQLAIVSAVRPLQPHEEAAFLVQLKALLAGRNEIGDGELGRALARLQREHFRPPTDDEVGAAESEHRTRLKLLVEPGGRAIAHWVRRTVVTQRRGRERATAQSLAAPHGMTQSPRPDRGVPHRKRVPKSALAADARLAGSHSRRSVPPGNTAPSDAE